MNSCSDRFKTSLPAKPGLGLKTQHLLEFVETRPSVGFVEVHAENYMVKGGAKLQLLERVRETYPLSLHGVAASLGGESGLDPDHLKALKRLVDRFQPAQFSEHLAWSTHQGVYFNDLLPVPYTTDSLARVVRHIDQLQTFIGRQILIENPSTYLQFKSSSFSETEFISELVKQSGCGLLLDLNNVYVSCQNHGWSCEDYIRNLPLDQVGEIHLAGHAVDELSDGTRVLIDSHDADVSEAVWELYQYVIQALGPMPTLLERDGKVPPLQALIDEVQLCEPYLHA